LPTDFSPTHGRFRLWAGDLLRHGRLAEITGSESFDRFLKVTCRQIKAFFAIPLPISLAF
jgi:hypothetical protein